jgi:hypothetical protein
MTLTAFSIPCIGGETEPKIAGQFGLESHLLPLV